MKRTQRNLSIIMASLILAWLVISRLPLRTALIVAAVLLVFAVFLLVYGRDYLMGRVHARRSQWQRALERYEAFEKKLLKARLPALVLPLYVSFYSFDGVAIVRNHIGRSLLNLGELDSAERTLLSALQRDPLYPVPYLGLGLLAGMRRDATRAEQEIRKAVHLGYSPVQARAVLDEAIAHARRDSTDLLR